MQTWALRDSWHAPAGLQTWFDEEAVPTNGPQCQPGQASTREADTSQGPPTMMAVGEWAAVATAELLLCGMPATVCSCRRNSAYWTGRLTWCSLMVPSNTCSSCVPAGLCEVYFLILCRPGWRRRASRPAQRAQQPSTLRLDCPDRRGAALQGHLSSVGLCTASRSACTHQRSTPTAQPAGGP